MKDSKEIMLATESHGYTGSSFSILCSVGSVSSLHAAIARRIGVATAPTIGKKTGAIVSPVGSALQLKQHSRCQSLFRQHKCVRYLCVSRGGVGTWHNWSAPPNLHQPTLLARRLAVPMEASRIVFDSKVRIVITIDAKPRYLQSDFLSHTPLQAACTSQVFHQFSITST